MATKGFSKTIMNLKFMKNINTEDDQKSEKIEKTSNQSIPTVSNNAEFNTDQWKIPFNLNSSSTKKDIDIRFESSFTPFVKVTESRRTFGIKKTPENRTNTDNKSANNQNKRKSTEELNDEDPKKSKKVAKNPTRII